MIVDCSASFSNQLVKDLFSKNKKSVKDHKNLASQQLHTKLYTFYIYIHIIKIIFLKHS
jgi:hypothetical protein